MAISMLLPSSHVYARDYFNPALLAQPGESSATLDLSAFENGGQLPGDYPVDIYLNEERVDSKTVTFVQSADKGLQPCLSIEMLTQYGVKVELFPALLKSTARCIDLADIPDGSAEFVFSAHRLNISIPQAAVNTQARGYVPPSQWDEGSHCGDT
jgi:P pilus assembly protein, porin PapC